MEPVPQTPEEQQRSSENLVIDVDSVSLEDMQEVGSAVGAAQWWPGRADAEARRGVAWRVAICSLQLLRACTNGPC